MKFSLPEFLKRHKHDWELVAKTVSEPKNISTNNLTTSFSQDFLDKLIFGMTTYVWECVECGATRKQECLGTENTSLDEILDRVDSYGSQQVARGNKQYVVVHRSPQPHPINPMPQRLPIRKQ